MKLKKLLLVLVAIILIIPAAIIFTACGNNDNHVYLNNVVIRYADGTEKGADSNYINLGSFEYGSSNKPNLDFIVVAKFSDNSETTILSGEIGKEVNNVTVKFKFNGEEIEELPIFEQSSIGYYEITITYQEKTISISYSIGKSDNVTYTPILSRYKWEFGTYNPVPTINNYSGTEELIYFYLPYSQKDNVGKGGIVYSYTKEANIAPGKYVLWTDVPATDNYYPKTSEVVEFEVTKGILRIDKYGTITAGEYHYFGEFGNIKLSQLGITANDFVIKNQKGDVVNGSFEWINKDEKVDSNSTGLKAVVFVDNDNCYNPLTVKHINIQGKITKGRVDAPELFDTSVTYTGNDIDLYLYKLNHNFLFDISFNENKVTPDSNGKIATVRNAGTYTIIVELKDKVNYVWDTEENSNNIVLTFEVKPAESYCANELFNNLILSTEGKVEIKLDDETLINNEYYYITPYVRNTVAATAYKTIEINGTTCTSDMTATCTVENRADGFNYLVITVTSFDVSYRTGVLYIHLIATGAENFKNLDTYLQIYISKYEIDTSAVENNYVILNNPFVEGDIISQKTFVTPDKTYEWQNFETSSYGQWVVEYEDAESNFVAIDVNSPLQIVGTFNARIRFVPANEFATSFTKTFILNVTKKNA